MAADAIPPPLFCGRRRHVSDLCSENGILRNTRKYTSVDHAVERPARSSLSTRDRHCRRIFENMANTTSAKKAKRKIARRTIINKSRRTRCAAQSALVEEAIKSGDRDAALKAMTRAEPELMQAAQRNIIHKNNAAERSRGSHIKSQSSRNN